MYLKLQRQPPNGETLRGHLCIDGMLYCDTLERTSKAILPLVYPVQVTMSPKFNRLLPLVMNWISKRKRKRKREVIILRIMKAIYLRK